MFMIYYYPEKSISHKKSYGGTSLEKVVEAIKRAKKKNIEMKIFLSLTFIFLFY